MKNPQEKTSLGGSSLTNGLPEGKGGRERRCKSQADITACSGQAGIREIRGFWDGVLVQQEWPRAVLPARACLI